MILTLPLVYEPIVSQVEWLGRLRAGLAPLLDKTQFGLLRGLHFLALAYLAYSWFHQQPAFLQRPLAVWVRKAGEHSLPVFLLGMNLSYLGGMVLDQLGHGVAILAVVNFGGCALLIAAAHGIAWLDTKPWRNRSRSASRVSWNSGAEMVQGFFLRCKTQTLRSLATGALLLPLSLAPLYLVNRHAMSVKVPLQLSDSADVLEEPYISNSPGADTDSATPDEGPELQEG